MGNNSYKHTKIFYIYLVILLVVAVVFAPIVYLSSFQHDYSYHLASFVITIVDIAMLLILFIAELASLTFDRTASKNTMYATLFLLLGYLTSNDVALLFNFVGASIPDIALTILQILHHLFFLSSLLCFLTFFERDFKIKIDWKIHIIFFSLFSVFSIIFNTLNLFYGLLALAGVESVYALYFFLIRYKASMKNKSDNYAGIVTLIVCFIMMLSTIFDLFYGRDKSFIGISGLLFIVIISSYLTIYIDFFIKKTLSAYSYEDEKNKEIEKKSHVLVVNCFHCFDCTYDGKHLDFPSKKAKELFALLVILRGKSLSIEKAITYLWPDKDLEKAKLLYRNAIMKLRQYFKDIDCPYLSFRRGETILDITNVVCDYYDVIDGKKEFLEEPLLPEYEWSLEFENSLK